jgi:pimeloyl-ACP methyl ester carboxylesterase
METPTLVLVHGYPFDHTLWDHVVPLLGDKVQVLTPDLRGFGGRPVGTDSPSLGRMADDLKELLDQQTIRRAVVAGMSMGGYVALAFAEHYPERLAGLGLISTQAAADTDEAKANRRAMIDKVRRDGPNVAAQAVIPKLFAPANSTKSELIRFPTVGAERAGAEGIAWALEAMAQRPDRTATVRELRVPVLVVHGAEDKIIPAAGARELARLTADGQYVEIEGAGHATPIEGPLKLAQALLELVNRSFETSLPGKLG